MLDFKLKLWASPLRDAFMVDVLCELPGNADGIDFYLTNKVRRGEVDTNKAFISIFPLEVDRPAILGRTWTVGGLVRDD